MVKPSRDHFYKKQIINNLEFDDMPVIEFGFQASGSLMFINDSKNNISFSFNGEDLDGEVLSGERLVLDRTQQSRIWMKTDKQEGSGNQIRIWAWL